MQKVMTGLIAAGLILAVFCGVALADQSSMTSTYFQRVQPEGKLWYADYVLTANTSGDYSQTTHQTDIVNGFIFKARTAPGSAPYIPTASYDITLNDASGLDVMGGALADRSETAVEWVTPLASDGTSYVEAPVQGALYINITNNSVNAAVVTVRLYILRP